MPTSLPEAAEGDGLATVQTDQEQPVAELTTPAEELGALPLAGPDDEPLVVRPRHGPLDPLTRSPA
ncbi:hypothetical protein [Streptosporangium sp. LJ11]|uniref:hypothetical protein n=1 Tax=Streptosporangium sp. LJ11 TaxID=3436927 RepID=UPI003F7A7B91